MLPATEAKFRTGALTERQATDEDERHRRAHRRRHFRHWVDPEGSYRFSGSLTPDAGAIPMAGIEPHRQALSRQAAESDKNKRRRRDSDAAVAADALGGDGQVRRRLSAG